ncbi:MAG: DnaJ domain-containing protein [Kordiimonadaceae bacterium]|nr:DnaJ domain-containing protein [Kordiimonadaceae bacterium]MBO6569859.1 DnaJ domain-containing protein [Kordiimonadaceae bacterium]MBO6966045.1 DnaJ domain-containing protein [Kordiimonadaceae bacterium]
MAGYFVLGLLLAGLLFLLLNWWANAEIKSAKRSLTWAIVGVCLVLGLILIATGKALLAAVPAGFALFRMAGPALAKLALGRLMSGKLGGKTGKKSSESSQAQMTRAEALEVLGLEDGASKSEINEAYRRLMGQVHPDKGGSDWMAAKLNAARKTLLE